MACCNGYHEFNLDWLIERFKEIEDEWNGTEEWLQNWVESFDISGEVRKVLQGWIDDGTFEQIINEEVLGDLNNKVNQNTSDISALESKHEQDIDELESKIAGNSAAIQGVDSRVKELEKRKPINALGKRYILIADSYGQYEIFDGFINVLNGIIVEQKWVEGAGFTKTGDQSFTTIINSLPSHSDVDYVVVFGLYNDSFDVNNLTTKVVEFKNAALDKYPGAQIVIVNQGWSSDPSLQGQFQYLIEHATSGFAANSVTVINTWKYLHVYSRIADDKIHPSSNAVGKQLGSLAGKILAGGNLDISFAIRQIQGTFINGWQAYGSWSTPYQEMNNEEVLVHFVSNSNHVGIDAGTSIKCNGNNYVEVYEFPDHKGCVIGSGDMLLNVPCLLGDTSNIYRQASCTLEIYDRKLRIRPFLLNTEGNDFATIALNSIQWTPCTIRGNINHI